MKLHIEPAGRGRARLRLMVECSEHGVTLGDELVALDPDAPWTRAVACHLSAVSGGELTTDSVLCAIRTAQAAELGARWSR